MNTTRRQFLKSSLATASIAACGIANRSRAKSASSSNSITDTQIYLGHWPLQSLPNNTPETLRAPLRSNNITQAWTGSFDALFYKDIAAVNERLAETCKRSGDGMFIPFGAVNPTLPDWEDDIRRCHETFHMPGIRLHPNYHGYTLDDPRFARLLNIAATRGLIVQLVASMADETYVWLNPLAPKVDLDPLPNAVAELQGLRVVIAGGVGAVDDTVADELARNEIVYFDVACSDESPLKKLIDQVPIERVLFGSAAPLHPMEAALSKLKQADLMGNDRLAIENDNARKLLMMK
jgi:predicted TIM-barrel fold metal-dependent hydrolase